ncbi:MAG: class B sortase [Sarcina sp.]
MNKSIKVFLNISLISILGFSLFKIGSKVIDYKKADKTYSQVKEVFNNTHNSSSTDKYLKLKEINNDYKFWINIDNTNVDYPVVQTTNNQKYLKTDFNGQESTSGAVFLDFRNTFNDDFNRIIYGHNMKNKSIFNNVENFKKKDFFDKNNKIHITDENYKYTFEVFSVYTADGSKNADSHIMINNTDDSETLQKYLNTIINKSLFKKDLEISSNDKIITLATCSYEGLDIRTVVHGKLINVENI